MSILVYTLFVFMLCLFLSIISQMFPGALTEKNFQGFFFRICLQGVDVEKE